MPFSASQYGQFNTHTYATIVVYSDKICNLFEIISKKFVFNKNVCNFVVQTEGNGCTSRIILMDTPIFFTHCSQILINLTNGGDHL